MILYLDCEFTNFQGHLISMAMVDENGHEFYEVVNHSVIDCHQWVIDNVLPILHKDPIPYQDFQRKLSAYLRQYDSVEIVADWPEDFWHLNMALLTGPGMMMTVPKLSMHLVRGLNYTSAIPHNALEDAKAIRIAMMKRESP